MFAKCKKNLECYLNVQIIKENAFKTFLKTGGFERSENTQN